MYLAFERLLPRVRPQVHHKLRLVGKLLRAVLADVGLLGALRLLRPRLLHDLCHRVKRLLYCCCLRLCDTAPLVTQAVAAGVAAVAPPAHIRSVRDAFRAREDESKQESVRNMSGHVEKEENHLIQ